MALVSITTAEATFGMRQTGRDSAQSDGRTRPESKSRVKRFSKIGRQGVEVDRRCRGGSVEGQSARRTVHIHAQSVAGSRRRGGGDEFSFVAVADRVTAFIGTAQTPGDVVKPKLAVVAASFTSDVFVSHRYLDLPFPLNLPETAIGQPFFTHHLGPEVESIWMIWIQLILLHTRHLPVVVRQLEFPVHCVCVNCEPTGI